MIIVTSYRSPDLDGIACSIAYSELLNKLGRDVKTTYYGKLGLEVKFVKEYTNYFPVKKHDGKYDEDTKFILVDTSDPEAIEPTISPKKVIKIFDHRQLVFVEKFINAEKAIELVGSCATLIIEEFQKNNLSPSENAAIYLYSAIISNTINFKNSVTTERDRKAIDWLKAFLSLPNDYIKRMFSSKSNINSDNLYEVISQDFAIKAFNNKVVGIAQIEITDLELKLEELKDKLIEILTRFKKENNLDYVFFTGIDIFDGFNIFYPLDEESREFFSKVLEIPDLKPGYKTKEIIMRKQFWPKIEKLLL
jgi:inorganic pyrophosphatase/exopolyphosphatase